MSGRHWRDDIKVLWVEDVAEYESDRVCLLRRSEEFVPEVREFCMYNTSKQSSQWAYMSKDHLGVSQL